MKDLIKLIGIVSQLISAHIKQKVLNVRLMWLKTQRNNLSEDPWSDQ